jgi:peptide-methionine (S)-S-oxide reductase
MFRKDPHTLKLPDAREALPGRAESLPVPAVHRVLGNPLLPPFPEHLQRAVFGMGCFWGAERLFWRQAGVWTTAAGYAGGHTPNPTYEEVCSGRTAHAEVVLVVFDPRRIDYAALLQLFWASHDPTQGMRQGNDVGTQYRSVIHCADDGQLAQARASAGRYEVALAAAGYGAVTTEIVMAPAFWYAEAYHQQYLDRVPDGYCGLRGTGVACHGVS